MSPDLAIYALLAGVIAFATWREWTRRRHRPHFPTSHFPVLTEGEMRAALSVGDEHLLWRAVHQCIAVQRAEALREVQDPDTQLRPALLHYYAGAAAHLDDLADFLRAQREEALKGNDQ